MRHDRPSRADPAPISILATAFTFSSKTGGRGALRVFLALLASGCLSIAWIVGQQPDWLHLNISLLEAGHLVMLLASIAIALLFLRSPTISVLALIVLMFTNASEIGVRYHGLPSVLQLCVLLALSCWAYHVFVLRSWTTIQDPIYLIIGAYAAVLGFSSIYALNTAAADEALLDLVKSGLLVFVIVNLVRTDTILDLAIDALIVAAVFLATVSAFQVLTDSYGSELGGFGQIKYAHISGRYFEERIAGPLADPNFYAQILAPVVPLALLRARGSANWWQRSYYLSAVLLLTLVIGFTYSRAGLLVLALVILLALLYMRLPLRVWAMLGVAGLLAVSVVPDQFSKRLQTLEQLFVEEEADVQKLDTSFRQRQLYMMVAWEMFEQNPVLGVGAGNYSDNYVEYSERYHTSVNTYKWIDTRKNPHSLYLQIAAETGFAGLLVFAMVPLAAFASSLAAYAAALRLGRLRWADNALALSLALTSYLGTSMFLHGDYMRYFWLIVALQLASWHVVKNHGLSARAAPVPTGSGA